MGFFDIFRKKKTLTLEEAVKELKKEGLSGKEIYERLMGPMTNQVFSGLGVSEERIEELIEDSTNYNEATSVSADVYRWVLGECGDSYIEFYKDEGVKIESEKYCNDCLDRNNQEYALDEWELIGKPQSGFSVCGTDCGCSLELVTKN